jgi:hypothetical protein
MVYVVKRINGQELFSAIPKKVETVIKTCSRKILTQKLYRQPPETSQITINMNVFRRIFNWQTQLM